MHRRQFMKLVGGGTAAVALASYFPDSIKAAVKESLGPLEKTQLNASFPLPAPRPLSWPTPWAFMSATAWMSGHQNAGWAVAQDKSSTANTTRRTSPAHAAYDPRCRLDPEPFIMPAVENINGKTIVLHNDHLDKRDRSSGGFIFGAV